MLEPVLHAGAVPMEMPTPMRVEGSEDLHSKIVLTLSSLRLDLPAAFPDRVIPGETGLAGVEGVYVSCDFLEEEDSDMIDLLGSRSLPPAHTLELSHLLALPLFSQGNGPGDGKEVRMRRIVYEALQVRRRPIPQNSLEDSLDAFAGAGASARSAVTARVLDSLEDSLDASGRSAVTARVLVCAEGVIDGEPGGAWEVGSAVIDLPADTLSDVLEHVGSAVIDLAADSLPDGASREVMVEDAFG
ncbi:hypothetical protein T484DRAFT_1899428, partial [Baffinella frigidus]